MGNSNKPDYTSTKDVQRNFDAEQVDLTATTSTYLLTKLRGGEAVVIKAKVGNTGNVYLGEQNVSTTNGFELAPGEAVEIRYSPEKATGEFIKIYAVCATAGDDVCFMLIP